MDLLSGGGPSASLLFSVGMFRSSLAGIHYMLLVISYISCIVYVLEMKH